MPLPMRFPDGYEAAAQVYTFHGLADRREHLAFGFGRPEAVERIASVGGYLIYLRQEGRGIGLYAKIDAYELQDGGLDTYEANLALGHDEDERDYTVAAEMLHALGHTQIALLTNNPDKAIQLAQHGITIIEKLAAAAHVSSANARYLATKARRGAHTLDVPWRGADRTA